MKELPKDEKHHLIININESNETINKSSEVFINSGKGNADSHHTK